MTRREFKMGDTSTQTAAAQTAVTSPGAAPVTFVHIRRRGKPDDAAAPADVLYDDSGHAFHHTRKHGVRPHHEAHKLDPHTVPYLTIGKDSMAWIADQEFTVSIEPKNPFATNFPMRSTPVGLGAFHVVESGPPREGTRGNYKATFSLGALTVDPDFKVGP